jgi:type VI secretion system protein ImpJ
MASQSYIVPTIQWHDGMPLSPHHFQQQNLRDQQVLAHHFSYSSPYHWGIQNLNIDEVTLPSGLFRVQAVDIGMPDGLVYQYNIGEVNSLPLECDLTPSKNDIEKDPVAIQLVIPMRVPDISPLLGASPRFKSYEGKEVVDENTNDNPISIPRLVPNFFLHIGATLPSKFIGFPIAKVGFKDGVFKTMEYTPACFYIEEHAPIIEKCETITRKIREKTQTFSEKWQNQVGSNLLQETADILRPLITLLPTMEVLVSRKFVSPYFLYCELMRAAGVISQLALSRVPQKFAQYCHDSINLSIEPIIEYINECIDRISLEYTILPFAKNDRFFSLKLHALYFNNEELIVGVKARQGTRQNQVEDWMNEAVIVSDGFLQKVKGSRVLGAARSLINDERLYKMSPPHDVTMFSVKTDKSFVAVGQYLHIFNPSDNDTNRPMDAVLYVPKHDTRTEKSVAA